MTDSSRNPPPSASDAHEPHATTAAPLQLIDFTPVVIYPARQLLSSERDVGLLNRVIDQSVAQILRHAFDTTWISIACEVHESLFGAEPLTTRQMLSFLDAFALAARQHLARLVEQVIRPRPNQRASDVETLALSSPHHSTVRDQRESKVVGTHDDLAEAEMEGRCTVAKLTLSEARRSPDSTARKLAMLDGLRLSDPQTARWFEFVELTGATTQEVARYFEVPESLIDESVDMAALQIRSFT